MLPNRPGVTVLDCSRCAATLGNHDYGRVDFACVLEQGAFFEKIGAGDSGAGCGAAGGGSLRVCAKIYRGLRRAWSRRAAVPWPSNSPQPPLLWSVNERVAPLTMPIQFMSRLLDVLGAVTHLQLSSVPRTSSRPRSLS